MLYTKQDTNPLTIAPSPESSLSEADAQIEAAFRSSYVYTTHLKNAMITITSQEGNVTLLGGVARANHKPMAGFTAEALSGVKQVDNRLEVPNGFGAANTDEWVSSKLGDVLVIHRSLNAEKTQIEAKDGIVTLRGNASSQAQKELTEAFARDIQGVREVRNEMTVLIDEEIGDNDMARKLEKNARLAADFIDDASITAQVRVSLLLHRSTSALKTQVETKDSIVTLGGIAANEAEFDLVSKLVNDIKGVKGVINNMSIERIVSESD